MSVLQLPAGLAERASAVRSRLMPEKTGTRFLDRPYASVQLLLVSASGLLIFGVMMAVSTTIAASNSGNTTAADSASIWAQMIKEFEFVLVGLPIFWFTMRLAPKAFRLLAYPIMALGFFSLVAVLIPGIGFGVYGARRWIDLGPFQLQPSEFAKIGVLLWGADLLSRKQALGTLTRARHLFIPLVPGFALIAGLVMLEPDLGTTCCYLLILLGLLWMVGMPLRYFAVMVGFVGGAVTLLALAAPYRWQRVTSFLHPFSHAQTTTYHAAEAIYALASGGFFGVGLGEGTSKYGWVPNANSDFVFSIIGEELGLLGCLAVLLLFAMFTYTGLRIARRNADPFVRLAAGAATVWIAGQAVINVGYVTALLPVTGIPLPFISAGGTSLLAMFFVLGMLTSFARHEAPAVAQARKDERLGRRSRLQRWLHVPVPQAYVPPKRRRVSAPARPAPSAPTARRQPARPAVASSSGPRVRASNPLRPTGTDGSRRAQ
jgi:cell division protein FtsW